MWRGVNGLEEGHDSAVQFCLKSEPLSHRKCNDELMGRFKDSTFN
jgi:hypothetical protein